MPIKNQERKFVVVRILANLSNQPQFIHKRNNQETNPLYGNIQKTLFMTR